MNKWKETEEKKDASEQESRWMIQRAQEKEKAWDRMIDLIISSYFLAENNNAVIKVSIRFFT